jgi:hypothetical protein
MNKPCHNCGEELDQDCNGNPRCPNCDDPCPCCSDGPGYSADCEHPNAIMTDEVDPPTYHCHDCGEDFIGIDQDDADDGEHLSIDRDNHNYDAYE